MSFTNAEEERLQAAEEAITQLQSLIEGMGSANQLNRLYVLAYNGINALTTKVDALTIEVQELLELARKLQ